MSNRVWIKTVHMHNIFYPCWSCNNRGTAIFLQISEMWNPRTLPSLYHLYLSLFPIYHSPFWTEWPWFLRNYCKTLFSVKVVQNDLIPRTIKVRKIGSYKNWKISICIVDSAFPPEHWTILLDDSLVHISLVVVKIFYPHYLCRWINACLWGWIDNIFQYYDTQMQK